MKIAQLLRDTITKLVHFCKPDIETFRSWQLETWKTILFILEPIKELKNTEDCTHGPNGRKAEANESVPASESNPTTNEQNRSGKKWYHHTENKKFYMEGVAFLIGLIALAVYFVQAKEAKRQAIAAEQQLVEMQTQRRLDERAWIAPTTVTTETSKVWTNKSVFKLYFKNTGKTPALHVSYSVDSITDPRQVPTNDAPIQTTTMMLAPDGVSFMTVAKDKEIVERVANGFMPFCIYGKITYADIFGTNHWTQFCWEANGDLNFRPSTSHNACDDAK